MTQATWHALKCEAVRWRRLKEPARAIECLVWAIAMTRQAADLSRETGSLLNYLADLYLQEGQLAQAEEAIRQALQINLNLPGSTHGLGADDFMILANILSRQARDQEAYEAAKQALALFQQRFGTHAPFLAQIEETVKELRRKKDRVSRVEWEPSRAEQAAAPDRPRD